MRPPRRTNAGPSPRQRMFRNVWTAQPYSAATSESVSRLPAASLAAGGAGVSGASFAYLGSWQRQRYANSGQWNSAEEWTLWRQFAMERSTPERRYNVRLCQQFGD